MSLVGGVVKSLFFALAGQPNSKNSGVRSDCAPTRVSGVGAGCYFKRRFRLATTLPQLFARLGPSVNLTLLFTKRANRAKPSKHWSELTFVKRDKCLSRHALKTQNALQTLVWHACTLQMPFWGRGEVGTKSKVQSPFGRANYRAPSVVYRNHFLTAMFI